MKKYFVLVPDLHSYIVQLKGSVEKGDKHFNSPKSSKVKKVFFVA